MAILKADPRLRRQILLLHIAFAVLTFGTVQWLFPMFEEYLKKQELWVATRSFQFMIAILFAPVLGMAYYMHRVAKQILASGQCPPPGTRVVRDTEILEVDAARRRGRLLLILSVVLAGAALVGMIYFPYQIGEVFGKFERQPQPDASLQQTSVELNH
ncbi:MAG TPA: hypothetical protein VFN94_04690 [Nitrospiria bacterium]|nr:hypothetical protein [Nitrospiria bacterium]